MLLIVVAEAANAENVADMHAWQQKQTETSTVLCYWTCWSLELIVKLKLESGNQRIQYGHQTAILKAMSLKINRPLLIYISIVPVKFGVNI